MHRNRAEASVKICPERHYHLIASVATKVWGHRIMGSVTFEDLLSVRRSDTGDVEVDGVRWPPSYVNFSLVSMNRWKIVESRTASQRQTAQHPFLRDCNTCPRGALDYRLHCLPG